MGCGTASRPARSGGGCRMTCRRGPWSTRRRGGGWPLAALWPWSMTCARSCAWPQAVLPQPTAAVFDSQTLQSTPESGGRGGYDGAKRRKGSKVHVAVDTLGQLLALHVTAADAQDRAQVEELARHRQEA